MNKIIAFIMDWIDRYRHANLGKTLASFDTLVTKVESYTSIAGRDLAKIQEGIENLRNARDQKNLDLDRAYRTLHNLSQLVK